MIRIQLKKLEKEHLNKSRVECLPTFTFSSLITLHGGRIGWPRAWGSGGLWQVSVECCGDTSGFSLLHFLVFLEFGSQTTCIRLFGPT